jgi:AcrR family transcriptional regulator
VQQIAAKWHPSPIQARVLECATAPGVQRTITAICEEAGVATSTVYRWLQKDADFAAAWGETWRGSIRRHLAGIVAAQVTQALSGDTPAARLLLEAAGVLKQEYGGSAPIVIRNYIGVKIDHE